jgi:hypothetical protein
VHAQHFTKDLPYIIVSEFAQRALRFPRADTRGKLFANALPLIIGLRAEYG